VYGRVVKSSIHHNRATLPQFAALEATAIIIPTKTETLTVEAVYAPPSRPLLVQELTTLTQCSQHFIFAGGYNAKHQLWHSRLTNTRGRTLYHHALQSNYEIIGPHTSTYFPPNCNYRLDVLDIAIIRKQQKQATIISIPKPNKNPVFPQNRRPISLLDNMGKVMEKAI
jgi:hypothetical protein